MSVLQKIADIELEIGRTQKNKATNAHLGARGVRDTCTGLRTGSRGRVAGAALWRQRRAAREEKELYAASSFSTNKSVAKTFLPEFLLDVAGQRRTP